MIGGTAMSVVSESDMIRPNNAKVGNAIVLTKPLGTQLAVNFNQWFKQKDKNWQKLEQYITPEKVLLAYEKAMLHMSTLNLEGAKLMKKYKAGAATDVTGFGILGHTRNLVEAQTEKVDFIIERLPVLADIAQLDKKIVNFKLAEGFSAETSGGLLICLEKEKVKDFIDEYTKTSGYEAWEIGQVTKGQNKAQIIDNVKFIEV